MIPRYFPYSLQKIIGRSLNTERDRCCFRCIIHCHLLTQQVNRSRSDCKVFLPSVLVTLLAIFVLSANFDILQKSPSSMSLTYIKNRTGPSTDSKGTPLFTLSQLDITPFKATLFPLREPVLKPIVNVTRD